MNVFISYSRENSSAAIRLSDELVSRGIKPWLDLREIEPGADWTGKVAEAVRSAVGFVFLIGDPESTDRGQRYGFDQVVEEEIYLNPAKPLIPVLLGAAELPAFLRTRKAIRVERSSIDFAALADEVAKALQHPEQTINRDEVERGRAARKNAQASLMEYARELETKQLRQSEL